jgi:hypothetical protein
MKRRPFYQGSEKLLMAENNFLFLIQQKKRFLKSDFFYRLVRQEDESKI